MSLAAFDVVTAGEAMMSLRWGGSLELGGPAQTSIAGAESNVAIGLARLGHSARFVGRVGADDPGALVLRTLRAEGVDTSLLVRDPAAATGLVLFSRPVAGTVSVTYHRTASAGSRLAPDDLRVALRSPLRALHVSGITLALSETAADATQQAVAQAKTKGALVSLDINYRTQLWDTARAAATLAPLVPYCDVLIGSPGELALVAGLAPGSNADAIVKSLLDAGATEVVTKLGVEGAKADTAAGSVSQPAFTVVEIDPVGAGDAFTAGYLSALLDGLDVADRLVRGTQVGALVAARNGDWEGAPKRQDLASLTDLEQVRR